MGRGDTHRFVLAPDGPAYARGTRAGIAGRNRSAGAPEPGHYPGAGAGSDHGIALAPVGKRDRTHLCSILVFPGEHVQLELGFLESSRKRVLDALDDLAGAGGFGEARVVGDDAVVILDLFAAHG